MELLYLTYEMETISESLNIYITWTLWLPVYALESHSLVPTWCHHCLAK